MLFVNVQTSLYRFPPFLRWFLPLSQHPNDVSYTTSLKNPVVFQTLSVDQMEWCNFKLQSEVSRIRKLHRHGVKEWTMQSVYCNDLYWNCYCPERSTAGVAATPTKSWPASVLSPFPSLMAICIRVQFKAGQHSTYVSLFILVKSAVPSRLPVFWYQHVRFKSYHHPIWGLNREGLLSSY